MGAPAACTAGPARGVVAPLLTRMAAPPTAFSGSGGARLPGGGGACSWRGGRAFWALSRRARGSAGECGREPGGSGGGRRGPRGTPCTLLRTASGPREMCRSVDSGLGAAPFDLDLHL